ncbi:MAG TPA: MraY family glycosyltransferase [Clostridia bacterium]|nr:MraY family glycosyltransferase [Clostridia bacterium]
MSSLTIIAALLGMTIVMVVVQVVLKSCARFGFLVRSADLHHTHQEPIPRFGGLALALAFIGVEVLIETLVPVERARTPGRTAVIAGSLAMFALGFWDDLRPLGAKKKLIGQLLIAGSVLFSGIGIQQFKIPFTAEIISLGPLGAVFTVLWLVAMTNLINIIDGIDGLAGGICLMLMLLIVFVGHQNGNFEFLAAGMAGALLGFLWFNFPPARIYLGDGGAYFLGFQIGLFAIVNSQKGTVFVALVAPLFVLALPIVDATLAILRRSLRGLPVFRPDRRHIHHRLIRMGLSRRRVVLWIYAITLLFLFMGLLAYWSRGNLLPILLGVLVVVLLVLAGKLKFSREWFSVGRVLGNSLNMRQQVRFALSLVRWLELEGQRHSSQKALFADLAFAAQKIGFTSLKLTCSEGVCEWQVSEPPRHSQQTVFQFKSGVPGTLEIGAPAFCNAAEGGESPACSCHESNRPGNCLADPKAFEILSELLVEGWSRAVAGLPSPSDGHALPSLQPKPGLPFGEWKSRLPMPRAAAAPPRAHCDSTI